MLPIYVQEISKSKECQDDLKKEPPPHDETIVRVAPIEITLEDFCRHLSRKVSSRVVSVAKGALVQTIASRVVDIGFKPLDDCVYGDVRKFRQEWGGRTGTFERTDARLKYGTFALKVEESVKITLNGGPADAVNIAALAQEIGRKIIVIDGEEKHSFDVDSEKEPIVLKYVRSDNDDKVGHYELANGKKFESSGENNCLYDAIAAETGMDPNELRKQTANLMMDNYMAFSKFQQNNDCVSLSGGKMTSREKHLTASIPDEPLEKENANHQLIVAEKKRWEGKKPVKIFDDKRCLTSEDTCYLPNGEKMRLRTSIAIDLKLLSQESLATYEKVSKNTGVPDGQYEVQITGKFRGYLKKVYVDKNGVTLCKIHLETVTVINPKFVAEKGDLVHFDHERTQVTPRENFDPNNDSSNFKFEYLRHLPKKSKK